MVFYLKWIVFILSLLFSVMFVTLLERKLLSYSQVRVGPNKVIYQGVLQPVLDGVKLLIKDDILLFTSNKFLILVSPFILIVTMVLLWTLIPSIFFSTSFTFGVVIMLSCIGVSVYMSLATGWVSNSKYSMLGCVRSMAQTISFEISLALVVFTMLYVNGCLAIHTLPVFEFWLATPLILVLMMILALSCVAECNRAPFDFAEGESELVSGFNTEYSSVGFALLFIGEYGMVILFSLLCTLVLTFSVSSLVLPFMLMFFIFLRSCYPRFRYDKFMQLCWFKFLPISITYLLMVVVLLF